MSYILDALKKAEEERRRHTESDRQGIREEISPPQHRRKIWPYLIIIALLANTGLLVWWTAPWNAGTTSGVQRTSVNEQELHTGEHADTGFEAKASFNTVSVEGSTTFSRLDPSGKDADSIPPDSSQEEKTLTETSEEKIHAKVERQDMIGTTPSIPTRRAAKVPPHLPPDNQKEPPPGDRIYAFNELPSSVLQDLPDLSISLLYYTDDPESRLISIKDKTLREGSELVPGLKVLEIASSSAVFGYRNYLFRVAVNAK